VRFKTAGSLLAWCAIDDTPCIREFPELHVSRALEKAILSRGWGEAERFLCAATSSVGAFSPSQKRLLRFLPRVGVVMLFIELSKEGGARDNREVKQTGGAEREGVGKAGLGVPPPAPQDLRSNAKERPSSQTPVWRDPSALRLPWSRPKLRENIPSFRGAASPMLQTTFAPTVSTAWSGRHWERRDGVLPRKFCKKQ